MIADVNGLISKLQTEISGANASHNAKGEMRAFSELSKNVEIRLFPHNYNPQSVYKNTLLASTLNNYLSTIFSLYPVA